jgi:ParB-like chromosome segregation protein Spo0J
MGGRKLKEAEQPAEAREGWEGNANKYERFRIEKVKRSDIHGADYNPRKISEAALKKLKQKIKKHGLVNPITINSRTMNIVGGHQRVKDLDDLIRKPDYELTVAVIDCDEKEEVTINVLLNNSSLQGEWDTFVLQDLKDIFPDIDYGEDFGFDESEIDIMFGDMFSDDTSAEAEALTLDPVKEAKKAEDFRAAKKEQREKAKEENAEGKSFNLEDSDYTVTIVFPNNREKADFMRKIRKDTKEKYIKSSVIFDISKGVYNLSIFQSE